MHMRLLILVLLGFFTLNAFAVDDHSLGIVFPLETRGNQVFVKYPILLNENKIVQAGALARIMFLMPDAEEVEKTSKKRSKVSDNPAFARKAHEDTISSLKDGLTPSQRLVMERALESQWDKEISFRAALERLNLENSRFVFQQPDSNKPQIERFAFPEGLFLAEINKKIVALYIQEDSPAVSAGFKPNTTLLSLNEKPFSSLQQFRDTYVEQKKSSRTLAFLVQFPSGEQKTLSIQLPRSLNTDFWSEIDKNKSTKTENSHDKK